MRGGGENLRRSGVAKKETRKKNRRVLKGNNLGSWEVHCARNERARVRMKFGFEDHDVGAWG